MIWDGLPVSAQLSFRTSCSRISSTLAAPLIQSKVECDTYIEYLRRDLYRVQCQAERQQGKDRLQHLCSYCRIPHTKELFSTAQLRLDPAFRLCLDAEGLFHICPHMAVQLAQLKRMLYVEEKQPEDLKPGYIFCDHPDHQSYSGAEVRLVNPFPRLDRAYVPMEKNLAVGAAQQRDRKDRQVISYGLKILRTDPGECWLNEKIRQVLSENDSAICPHLRLSDADIVRNILIYSQPLDTGRAAVAFARTKHHGNRCEQCCTFWIFARKRNQRGQDEVYLWISRDVYLPLDSDKLWSNSISNEGPIDRVKQRVEATDGFLHSHVVWPATNFRTHLPAVGKWWLG